MAKDSGNFIQKAIKHPGALRATAKARGAIGNDGDIKASFLDKAASGAFGKTTARRANLAKTLGKLRKK